MQWRSFPFGWLFLPVSLIGQPFSQKTRDHFLPLLTCTKWWSDTQSELRHVFSQDDDFQERMFARQIATMKGQAWNVVETLKTAEHGPLELTRRTRVCVWDDIVDIPVAVPLRMPSAEMRRRREAELRKRTEEEEMDISSANASTTLPQHDLLGLATSPADLPNPNRFSLSRNTSTSDVRPSQDSLRSPASPSSIDHFDFASGARIDSRKDNSVHFSSRQNARRPQIRPSLEGQSGTRSYPGGRRRNYSFGSQRRGSYSMVYDGDDLEGDLGYAAAEGMEGNQKRVIVERLEAVKSRNPVFSWC
jgi:hypothetical protein